MLYALHTKEIIKLYSPITMGEIMARAPGLIISRKDADATIETQRP